MKKVGMWLCLPASVSSGIKAQEITRSGFFFGAAIGGGVSTIHERGQVQTYPRISIPNLKAGCVWSEKTSFLLYIPTGASKKDGTTRAFEAVLPAVQYWVDDRWSFIGGIGLAMDIPAVWTVDFSNPKGFHFGPAVSASVSYEWWKKENVGLDVQWRILYGASRVGQNRQRHTTACDMVVGMTWY